MTLLDIGAGQSSYRDSLKVRLDDIVAWYVHTGMKSSWKEGSYKDDDASSTYKHLGTALDSAVGLAEPEVPSDSGIT